MTEFDLQKYHEHHGINISISHDSLNCVDEKRPAVYTYFLFNIKDDPLEKENLAGKLPCLVRDLESKINGYKKKSMTPVITKPPFFDPKSNPAKFGDKWLPGWC